jgi:uncharacterized membrane protein
VVEIQAVKKEAIYDEKYRLSKITYLPLLISMLPPKKILVSTDLSSNLKDTSISVIAILAVIAPKARANRIIIIAFLLEASKVVIILATNIDRIPTQSA